MSIVGNKDLQHYDELTLFKESIRTFCKKEIEPYYAQWEKDHLIPREFWLKLGEAGLLCVDIPEEYGGLGATFSYSAAVIEEICRLGYAAVGVNISVHANVVAGYILNSGTEEQKQKYLPKMVSGEAIGAIAMTEPNAGSDLQGIKTSAVLDESRENYILNGSKTFISNGQVFDFIIVVARTNPSGPAAKGTSLFIVDMPCDGVSRGKNLDKIGLQACDTSEVFLENVSVSSSDLLGTFNKGFITLMQELPRERIILAVGAQAAMEGVLDITIDYVQERTAFGQSISDFQNTRFKMAELKTKARVHRAFVDECVTLLEKEQLDTETASMAKLSCTEAQGEIVDECLQFFGGYGFMTEYPISRAFVDARVQRIYGGTSEIMKEIISRKIFIK